MKRQSGLYFPRRRVILKVEECAKDVFRTKQLQNHFWRYKDDEETGTAEDNGRGTDGKAVQLLLRQNQRQPGSQGTVLGHRVRTDEGGEHGRGHREPVWIPVEGGPEHIC